MADTRTALFKQRKENIMIEVPNYTQIPNVYFDEIMQILNQTENIVFLVIMRKTFGWHKKRDNISYSQIMELSGIKSRSTVSTALKGLLEKGLIETQKAGQLISYTVAINGLVQKMDQSKNCTGTSPNSVLVEPKTSPNSVHTKEKNLNKDKEINNTVNNTKEKIQNKTQDQFMIFYQNYPKKTNKTDARKTFNKLIKSGVSLDLILSKLTIYKKQIEKDQTDIKYIKNPQRFLNCLEDYEAEEEKKPVSEKRICPSCGSELSGLFCKTCMIQYNEKMEATF